MTILLDEICKIVENSLKETNKGLALTEAITHSSTMDNTREWDSLSFVHVFLGVSQHFKIDVDEDDAISFTSVQGISDLIVEIRGS